MFKLKNKLKFLNRLENYSISDIPFTEVLPKIGMILALVITIPLMFPSGRSFKSTDLTEGKIATKKVIAPFEFLIRKFDNELTKERADASSAVPPYFYFADSVQSRQVERFNEFMAMLQKATKEVLPPERVAGNSFLTVNSDSLAYEIVREQATKQFGLNLNIQDIKNIFSTIRNDGYSSFKSKLHDEFASLGKAFYINISKEEIRQDRAIIISNGIEETLPLTALIDESEINAFLDSELKRANLNNHNTLLKVFSRFIQPNILYMEEFTEQRRREAVAAVPIGKDIVYENERIVDANERVTRDIYQKLYSLEIEIAEKSKIEGDLQNILSQLGKFLLTTLILIMYILYLSANRNKVFRDNKKLLLISILILGQVSLGALIVGPLGWQSYIIPTTIASMLLGILFDPGIGLVGTVVIGLLLAGITGFDYAFAVLIMFVGIVGNLLGHTNSYQKSDI